MAGGGAAQLYGYKAGRDALYLSDNAVLARAPAMRLYVQRLLATNLSRFPHTPEGVLSRLCAARLLCASFASYTMRLVKPECAKPECATYRPSPSQLRHP